MYIVCEGQGPGETGRRWEKEQGRGQDHEGPDLSLNFCPICGGAPSVNDTRVYPSLRQGSWAFILTSRWLLVTPEEHNLPGTFAS